MVIVKDDKIISGKIFNMYSEDGKQYFDILDSTVTDQIIPGVPIECKNINQKNYTMELKLRK